MRFSAKPPLVLNADQERAKLPNLVLNVDDDPAKLYVKTRRLKQAGYDVVEAATGAEALALARARQPALVLLDIHLPDINGFVVSSQLKADPLTSAIPVLAISSYFDESQFDSGIEGDCDTYLAEPVLPSVLLANVRSLVRLRAAVVGSKPTTTPLP